jgi:hypothetical protein
MLLSRRDRLIVARHGVPGSRCRKAPSRRDGRSVQSSRWDGAIFLIIPGTSCLATIVLSLRDKNHSPLEAPRIIFAFVGEPWAMLFRPLRATDGPADAKQLRNPG